MDIKKSTSVIEKKLLFGFGILLSMTIILAIISLYILEKGQDSNLRLSELSELYDAVVIAKEENYRFIIDGDSTFSSVQASQLSQIDRLFTKVSSRIIENELKFQASSTVEIIGNEILRYSHDIKQGITKDEIINANNILSDILKYTNELYYAEQAHGVKLNDKSEALLTIIPVFFLICGGTFALLIGKRVATRFNTIEENELRLKAIYDTAVDGIITIDSSGIIKSTNRSVGRLLGWSERELVGKNIKILMPEPDSSNHDSYLRNYIKTGEQKIIGKGRDLVALRKDGKELPIRLAVGRVDLKDELLFVGFITDISDRKKLEVSLKKEAQNAEKATIAKSTLLANVSHEIRTPMNAILGFSELLLNEDLVDSHRKHLNTIRQSARSLLGLLNDLLDSAKLDKGKVELELIDFPLCPLIEQVISSLSLLAAEKNISVELISESTVPTDLIGDPLRIQQIITNILGNAIKFTEKGGVKTYLKYEEGVLIVAIQDTGIGMSDEQIIKVMSPFSQADPSISRRFGGTGLGTSIAYQLIELMSGELDVESEVGIGTTFTIKLPLAVGHTSTKSEHDNKASELLPLRVLAADDVPQNLELVKLILEKNGHKVTTCLNGKEAIKLFTLNKYDAVLMDLHMPEVDGLRATRAIRKFEHDNNLSSTPIIALSASVMAEDKSATRKVGMNGFVTKPLDEKSLLNGIKQALNFEKKPQIYEDVVQSNEFTLIDSKQASVWGNKNIFLNGVRQFLTDIPRRYPIVYDAVSESNLKEIRNALHGVKGGAGNLGLRKIQTLASQAETILESREYVSIADNLQALRQSISETLQEVNEQKNSNNIPIKNSEDFQTETSEEAFNVAEKLKSLCESNEFDHAVLSSFSRLFKSEEGREVHDAVENFDFEQAVTLLSKIIEKSGIGGEA